MRKRAGIKKHIHNTFVFNSDKQNPLYTNGSLAESKYRLLFTNALNGIAFFELITTENGIPVDCRFIEVNSAFERMTGLKATAIIGKTVREILPDIINDPVDWIGRYKRAALEGVTVRFEEYLASLDKWYSIVAFGIEEKRFCVIFDDITERKKMKESVDAAYTTYCCGIRTISQKRNVYQPTGRGFL